jgi:hypothetical protein
VYETDRLRSEFVRVPAGWSPPAGWVIGSLDRLSPAVGARWGVLGSYDGDLTGLSPVALGRLSYRLQELHYSPVGARLLERAGVDFVVSLDREPYLGALVRVFEDASVYESSVHLLRARDPLPKAYFVGRARVVAGDDEALRLMEDPAYDPRREVLLQDVAPAPPPEADEAPARAAAVRALARRSDALTFEVDSTLPGYLVVLEAYDRGWRASVDGRPAPVFPASALFRAVPVPAGVHRVELRYRPPAFAWGALTSALGLLAAGLLLVRPARVR